MVVVVVVVVVIIIVSVLTRLLVSQVRGDIATRSSIVIIKAHFS
jgi:hypothetical protein